MWVAPSAPEITNSNIWNDIKKATQHAVLGKQEAPIKILSTAGGGSVTVYSAREGIRGAGLHGVVVDEAAQIDPIVWTEVILPALVDKKGWAILCTTPKGLNWINRLFVAVKRRPKDYANWAIWQEPTENNPLIDPEELRQAKIRMGPRAYAQEHGAEFMEIEGALWPADYFHERIWVEDWPDRFELSVVCLDPSMGKTEKSDYQAGVFMGVAKGKLWVDSRMLRKSPMELVEEIDDLARKSRANYVGVEYVGFQEVLRTVFDIYARNENIPPLPLVGIQSDGNKVQRIQRLDPYLAADKIRFRRTVHNETLLDQLIMFPQAEHDDGPDAMEMCIRLLNYVAKGNHNRGKATEEVLVPV
jgi:predicted phage terminase large subunit-like protein